MRIFFIAAGFDPDDPVTEEVSWREVSELFFNGAAHIRTQALNSGREWSHLAPRRLDRKLRGLARSGQYEGIAAIPPELAEELWRRWNWAIIGATMEDELGQRPFDLHLPRAAPADARGWAVVLFVLLGPARNYSIEAIPP